MYMATQDLIFLNLSSLISYKSIGKNKHVDEKNGKKLSIDKIIFIWSISK